MNGGKKETFSRYGKDTFGRCSGTTVMGGSEKVKNIKPRLLDRSLTTRE